MYLDRVYRLQLEFCEISELLARSPKLELHDQLTQRRMEIVAEASELVYTSDAGIPIQRTSARCSALRANAAVSSD